MLKRLIFILCLLSSPQGHAFMELKSNFYASLLLFGRSDKIVKTHNTLLFGSSLVKLGGFYSHENIQENTVDTSYGGTLRVGEATFFELQIGHFERTFTAYSTIEGKGFMGNIILGKHFGRFFGISLMTTIKNITSGMDKRTIVKVLPYFGLRVMF